jgi:hypothetical protein
LKPGFGKTYSPVFVRTGIATSRILATRGMLLV